MHRTLASLLLTVFLSAPAPALADAEHVARPDSHAPIGVMGDHLHHAGEWMLSYRYSRMNMNGNRDDTGRIGEGSIRSDFGFPIVPFDMDMEMHMFGGMWAPHDDVTLMAMVPFVRLDMKHRTPTNRQFTTRSKGIGDVRLTGLVRLWRNEMHQLHLNAGLSLPTGDIDARDDTPMGRARLPYPMQIGSGTWDLLPGITYVGRTASFSWGGQLSATYRTGVNNRGYRLGHGWASTAWAARRWLPFLSTSLRLEYREWRNLRGDDDELPLIVETADPDRRAGRRLDLLAGVNLIGTGGWVRDHRLAIETGFPIHQALDGPQLETDWRVVVGWQRAF